ncbi:MAG: hypothetical protein KKF42_09015 [Actinobacteria bacterium]|nr:hypothetical protein [Actinomycetota bacterium]
MPLSFLKQYENAEERQRAMEQLSIEIKQLRTPEGKHFCIHQMIEVLNIYQQAEIELAKLTNSTVK